MPSATDIEEVKLAKVRNVEEALHNPATQRILEDLHRQNLNVKKDDDCDKAKTIKAIEDNMCGADGYAMKRCSVVRPSASSPVALKRVRVISPKMSPTTKKSTKKSMKSPTTIVPSKSRKRRSPTKAQSIKRKRTASNQLAIFEAKSLKLASKSANITRSRTRAMSRRV